MIVPTHSQISPLNMQLPEYCQLCADNTRNLPRLKVLPFFVTDENGPVQDPTKISFQSGFAAATFERYYRDRLYTLIESAAEFARHMGSSVSFTGPTPNTDISLAFSKITVQWEPHVVVLSDNIAAELNPLQRQWINDAKYLVFGFCKEGLKPNHGAYDAIATGLVMLDLHVMEAQSVDPSNHTPLNVSALAAEDFEQIVADVFSNRDGAWHWTLCTIQTALLVSFRARRDRRVPMTALTKFIANGGRHHTDDKA